MPPSSQPPLRHIAALDGLRAVAILLVLLDHSVDEYFPGGWIGVDLFFVLSGFLITSILRREHQQCGRILVGNFYWRRVLRLGPALGCFLAVYTLYALSKHGASGTLAVSVAAALFFVMNWLVIFFGDHVPFSHTWSLSVEEQFYAGWPFALKYLLERLPTPLHAAASLIAVCALCAAWRVYLHSAGASDYRIYCGFDTRVDTLLVGCIIALSVDSRQGRALTKRIVALWPVAAAAFAVFVVTARWNAGVIQTAGLTVVALLAGCLVITAVDDRKTALRRILEWKPMIVLGKLSFGMYLWHVPIFSKLQGYGYRGELIFVLGVPLTVAIAAVSYLGIEVHVLQLKERHKALTS